MSAAKQLVKKAFPEQIRTKRVEKENAERIRVKVGPDATADLINISESGLAIRTNSSLSENAPYPIEISFANGKPITMQGKIMWARNENGTNCYGITFSNGHLPEGILFAYEILREVVGEIHDHQEKMTSIDSKFKELTYEIRDYLENVKSKLDKLEESIIIESLGTRESFLNLVTAKLQPEFVENLKKYNVSLDKIFSQINEKTLRKAYISFFRGAVGNLYTSNPFIGRALRKPRGYAGDYEMMNQIYREQSEGSSLFEIMMHNYGINEASSLSVKYRKQYLIDTIIRLSKNTESFIVGSLACGPAREVLDFLESVPISESSKYTFILMDQDVQSLMNAKRNISDCIAKRALNCEVHFIPLSVKNILEQNEQALFLSQLKFDLLYTAGLYDYLTQPVAKLLTVNLYELVKPGGLLIIGNFHPNNPTKTISELVADWRLIHRNDQEMLDLATTLNSKSVNLHKDDQEIDLFLEVIK